LRSEALEVVGHVDGGNVGCGGALGFFCFLLAPSWIQEFDCVGY
jgi:hypothetical protein